MKKILLIFAFIVFTTSTAAEDPAHAPFDAAQVFEWWDDGIITAEEADEIFSRLEEENYDEACLLAEVYAQEPCSKPAPSKSKLPQSAQKTPTKIPHGHASWKGRYDSDGHLKKRHEELQIQFYYFKLRLGSQELLSYHRDKSEAYFGQISTIELHSHIPLDTLWGAALFYPIGKLRFGAFIDSSKTINAHIGFKPNRENELDATFWKFTDAGAIALQARTTLGQISTWYQFGQDRPLVKIQLQSVKKHLSWKTTAYLHGDSIPQGLNLSKGITENWLWASQTITARWPETLNSEFSFKARLLSPTATDSVSARFKATLTSGPEQFRPSLSVTCLEASDNCNTTEWKGAVESTWEPFSFKAGTKFRYDRNPKPPRIELGATYRSSTALAKLTIAFPETTPAKGFSVQNEIKVDAEPLGCDFAFAFKKTKTKPFKPNFAHIQANLKF